MSITINKPETLFKLDTKDSTYIIGLTPAKQLVNLYYGQKISDIEPDSLKDMRIYADEGVSVGSDNECPNVLTYEYGTPGCGDYRAPAVAAFFPSGHRNLDLRYHGYSMHNGKRAEIDVPGFFGSDSECETLEIELRDDASLLYVSLCYTVFSEHNAIVRYAKITNGGNSALSLEKAMSLSLSLPGQNKELVHLSGAWSRERHIEREAITHSMRVIGSTRGCSGHIHNPSAAIVSTDCTEQHGDAYGICLAYSGNFIIECENAFCDVLRVNCGIHPEGFTWTLEGGASFTTPEAALVYSHNGLGEMSRSFHRLFRAQLFPVRYKDKPNPVVVNNWEATYFDFDADKLVSLAREAAALKIDMLVMDDGWFGNRADDTSGLGDWVVNEKKLGCTLGELTANVQKAGTQFGLWIEPEMINEDTDLFRAHPDWCFKTPNKAKTPSRTQYVLDLTREDVLLHIESSIAAVLKSADIRYVKWDFNRPLTDVFSQSLPPERSGELMYRFVLNQYRLAAFLTQSFPDIVFQGCAGGGGRFDLGQLYFMPHIWASDDMDAIERMKIQYGTTLIYPPSVMSAHVCSEKNHVTGRQVPLETRAICAMMGGELGYGLDITTLTAEEKALISAEVSQYKQIEHLVISGDFYRLQSPFEGNRGAWCFVSADKTECAASCIQTLSEPNANPHRLLFDGLCPDMLYKDVNSGLEYHGDTLMRAGILLPTVKSDFTATFYYFTCVN